MRERIEVARADVSDGFLCVSRGRGVTVSDFRRVRQNILSRPPIHVIHRDPQGVVAGAWTSQLSASFSTLAVGCIVANLHLDPLPIRKGLLDWVDDDTTRLNLLWELGCLDDVVHALAVALGHELQCRGRLFERLAEECVREIGDGERWMWWLGPWPKPRSAACGGPSRSSSMQTTARRTRRDGRPARARQAGRPEFVAGAHGVTRSP